MKQMKPVVKKYLLLFSVVSFATSIAAQANPSPTPNTDLIQKIIRQNKPKNLDELLSLLPEDWRKEYLLVYNSRSLQSASLTSPRVILSSPDHQFFATFTSEQGKRPADATLEILETYGLSPARFATVSFEGRRKNKAKLNRDPESCAQCHGSGANSAAIFDGYPFWPGFYGSAHNGVAYGEPGGSAQLARLEFEENGMAAFIARAKTEPRYRQLLKQEALSVAKLSNRNGVFGTVIIAQLQERQSDQIHRAMRSVEELYHHARMSKPMADLKTGTFAPEILQDPYYAGYLDFVKNHEASYHDGAVSIAQERLARIRADVARYGTAQDRARIEQASVYLSQESYRKDYQPKPVVAPGLVDVPLINALNSFDDLNLFRMSALHYEYFLSQFPDLTPLKMNNLLLSPYRVRGMTGVTIAHVLLAPYAGLEDYDANGYFDSGRNYRDFVELFAWVPEPLKRYSMRDFANYPLLIERAEEVTDAFADIIQQSPLLKIPAERDKAKIFLTLKALPEASRLKIEKILKEAGATL